MVQTMAMSDLLLRVAIIEKNERGQEVELVRKTMQFKPQVKLISHYNWMNITEFIFQGTFDKLYVNIETFYFLIFRQRHWMLVHKSENVSLR